MKSKLFLLLLICQFSIFNSQLLFAQWFQLNSGLNQYATLSSVYFPDANTGYCVGFNTTIIKTTDAGSHWVNLNNGTFCPPAFLAVWFTDINTGFIVGGADCDTIVQTTDGGNSWFHKELPYSGSWGSIYFVNANTGYISCDEGVLLKTTDAGSSWFINYSYSYGFAAICFPDTSTGYVVSEGIIINTTDGGNNWIRQKTPYHLIGIYCTDINTCYAVGGAGLIVKTTDKGNNWVTIFKDATTIMQFNSVYFPDSNNGYAVGMSVCGYNGCYTKGIIYKTTNAGANWVKQFSFSSPDDSPDSTSAELFSVYFTDVNTGYAVGAHGIIFKTTNGGAVWVNQLEIMNYELGIEIYPNPVNESSVISYQLPGKCFVSISVYNSIGKEVETLVNETKAKGDYKLIFNSANLQNGIYFLRLNAGNASISNKMIIIK